MKIIIGAGFWGATLAERIATVLKEPVTIIDRRDHIGGNSSLDEETGIECHRYGSHIFHTSLPQVWEYINQFGEFTSYQHKVFITHKGKVYTMPITLSTINAFYGKNLRPAEAAAFLEAEIARDFIAEPKNLEECPRLHCRAEESGRKGHIPYWPPPVRSVHQGLYAQAVGA